ncbi:DUF87 domain-containing protein [Candidatus Micrarchaeota archaeon]|nr:DUF87 domain-containing protein [Candidatus Micrarchaeota archaeon]
MDESLGTIIASEGTPSTSDFSFVLRKPVNKGQYVQVSRDSGLLFGYVSEITKANRYFERAESVAEFEKNSGMESNFPSSSWEYVIALVKTLGTYHDSRFMRAFSPPSPGDKVFNADNNVLRSFLGFESQGLDLGSIEHHDLPARIGMTRLLQKHLAILAMSGAGKSHLTSVLLEELLDREKEQGRVAVIVVDIHGEYGGFAHDAGYGQSTRMIDGKDIAVPLRKVSPEMIMGWIPGLSTPQKDVLRHVLVKLKKNNQDSGGYGFGELVRAIDESGISREEVKRALKRSLGELRRYRFLSTKKENPRFISDIKPGRLMVLDFSTIDSLRKKQILVSLVARKLFNLRKKGKVPPFLLVIEESHNFAPQKAEERDAVSRSIIETVAREGRKFGASLCLVSQRPVNLSTTALSQCNSHIILRVTNPNDLEHIQMSSEGIDSRVARSITSLRVGEAIVVGSAVNYPVFIRVRDRKSEKREKGAPLHRQAVDFESIQAKREKAAGAFL